MSAWENWGPSTTIMNGIKSLVRDLVYVIKLRSPVEIVHIPWKFYVDYVVFN